MANDIPDHTINIGISDLYQDWVKYEKHMEAYINAYEMGIKKGINRFQVLVERKLWSLLGASEVNTNDFVVTFDELEDGMIMHVKAIDPTGRDYAMFLEYGTGIVGQATGHPDLPSGWSYNVGKTILPNGYWLFPVYPGDKYPVVATFNGQDYSITKGGQRGRAFMFQLYVYAKRQFKRTINSEIKKELKKIGG